MKKIFFIILFTPLLIFADAETPSQSSQPAPLYINVIFRSPDDLDLRTQCGFRCPANQHGEYIPERGLNVEKQIARLHREEEGEGIIYTIRVSVLQVLQNLQTIRYCVMKDPSPANNPTGALGSQIYRSPLYLNQDRVESLPQLGEDVQLTFKSYLQDQN